MPDAQTQERRIEKPGATLKDLLAKAKPSIEAVLPKHLSADRLIKVALVAISKTPKLQECSAHSILQAVMQSAELGLDCGGALGSAYLVPYKQTCTLIVGYRGMIELARRSGQIVSIEARAVFEGEQFRIRFGLEPVMDHVPNIEERPDPNKLRGCYVIARMKDGGNHVEWMGKGEIDAIRQRSKAATNGPWVTDYVEMARKTVVRRACKYLPLSAEMVRAVEIEDESAYGGATFDEISSGAERTADLAKRIDGDGAGEVIDEQASEETQARRREIKDLVQETKEEAEALAASDGEKAGNGEPQDTGAVRFDRLVGVIVEGAGIPQDEAATIADEWLSRHKYTRLSLKDTKRWKLLFEKAKSVDWAVTAKA